MNLTDFPVLTIDSENPVGSFKNWLREFEISVELATLVLGTEEEDGQKQDVFRGRRKVLTLLYAIGDEGRDALESLGCDIQDASLGYDDIMTQLVKLYDREETEFVKTMRFVSAMQKDEERATRFLIRVTKLSRAIDFGSNNDGVRERLAVAITVKGLRSCSLRNKLFCKQELPWQELYEILKEEDCRKAENY